jgi:BarA-like signal transduction histidine kinase
MKKDYGTCLLVLAHTLLSLKVCTVHCGVLEDFVAHYTRPYTAIQVGGGKNHLSKLSKKYPSSVFIIVSDQHSVYEELMHEKPCNCVLLSCHDDMYHIQRLSECEHFDVVFCSIASQNTAPDTYDYIHMLVRLGDNLIIELKNPDAAIQEYIRQQGGIECTSTPISTIYHVHCPKKCLTRKTWLRTLESNILIQSTFDEKKLIKKTTGNALILTSDWLPGINLITFKMCRGIYPDKARICHALHTIKYVLHNDWAMHNIIIQGTRLALIDYADPRMQGHEQTHSLLRKQTYNLVAQCLELDHPDDVENFYWKYLKTRPAGTRVKRFLKRLFHRN